VNSEKHPSWSRSRYGRGTRSSADLRNLENKGPAVRVDLSERNCRAGHKPRQGQLGGADLLREREGIRFCGGDWEGV